MLKPITDTSAIENFKDPVDLLPGTDNDINLEPIPEIHLEYNWLTKTLTGITAKRRSYTIDLLTAEGEKAVSSWKLSGTQRDFSGDLEALETLLKNGSLIKVSGHHSNSGKKFPEHRILLQQTGWSHKPLDLPNLTPEQILAIYAGMSAERRQLMLLTANIRKLIFDGTAGEITAPDDDTHDGQFFSEYAEIFYAFRKLKDQLEENFEQKNWTRVDYYLSGTGMDSIPALIERITMAKSNEQNRHKSVTVYLLLLCCQEIFQSPRFLERPRSRTQLDAIKIRIKNLRQSDILVLEDNSIKNRQKFFKEYKKKEPGIGE